MAKNFSVFVDIGGRLNASLPSSIRSAEALISGLNGRLKALHTATRSTTDMMGRGLSDAGKSLQSMGAKSTATVTAPLVFLGSGAAKTAFEFEKAGNMLEALGDATEGQRKNFEEFANTLNKKYPQTLTNIIKTGNEMLKGGFNFDQMTGAIDQTLATAVIGEMDPAEVGNMMSRTINSFQLPMKTQDEAMRSSSRVADQMTYAAVKTTASLKDMGEMYRYVGGAASAVQMPLEQASAFAMAFAKNGTVGSEAGVAMRSAIIRMIKPVKPQLATMGRIGMKLGDYVESKPITPDAIISSLQADGIDASKSKKQIKGLTENQELSKDPVKLAAEITKIVQAKLGREGSAVDAATIAQNVQDAVTSSGSKVDLFKFFIDFKKKVEKGEASMGELASMLQGQHFSRYTALVQSDLPALLEGIMKESGGYTQSRLGTAIKGIVAPVYEVSAALEKLSVTLGRLSFPDAAKGLSSLADAVTRMSEANPALLKAGLYAAGAAVAFGPLALAVGATVRTLGLFVRVIGTVGAAVTVGLASRVMMMATAFRAWAAASAVLLVMPFARLAATIRSLGLAMVLFGGVAGGAGLRAGIMGFGAALISILNPAALVTRAMAVLRFAVLSTGIGAALFGLAAAGTAIYNNWNGLGKAFVTFKAGFMAALGPEAQGALAPLLGLLSRIGDLWDSLTRKRSDGELMMWGYGLGRSLGTAAASLKALAPAFETVRVAWDAFTKWIRTGAGDLFANTKREFEFWWNLPSKIAETGVEFGTSVKGLAQAGFDALTGFEWSKAGGAIVDAIVAGLKAAGGNLVDAVKGLARSAVSGVAGALGFGGAPSAPATAGAAPAGAPAIAGARAAGGPVTGGLPYLVGEKGPEIFVPQTSGRIETNGVLSSLSKSGGRSGTDGLAVTVDASSIEDAGKTAKKAGRIITASLDTTTTPIIDTTSIEAALGKVATLKNAISTLGGEGSGGGSGSGASGGVGGTGGSSRASGSDDAVPRGTLRAASSAGGSSSESLSAPARAATRTASLGDTSLATGAAKAVAGAAGIGGAAGASGAAGMGGAAAAAVGGEAGYTGNDGRRSARNGMSASGRDNVRSWNDFFTRPVASGGMGLEADKAKGMIAMMQGESGLNLDPTAKGDHNKAGVPQSFGTVQWNVGAGRFGALKKHADEMGVPWTDRTAQQSFFRKEMLEGNYRGAWNKIKGAEGGEGALAAGIKHYENPQHHSLAYAIRKPFLDRLRNAPPEAMVGTPGLTAPDKAGAPDVSAVAKAGVSRAVPGSEKVNAGYGVPLHKGGTGLSRYSDDDLRRMTAADTAAKAATAAAILKPNTATSQSGNSVTRAGVRAPATPAASRALMANAAERAATGAPKIEAPKVDVAVKAAAPVPSLVKPAEPIKLAGARAKGGPVAGGKSYLVGERGPEIFTPGLTGAISTNSTLNSFAGVGRALAIADAVGQAGAGGAAGLPGAAATVLSGLPGMAGAGGAAGLMGAPAAAIKLAGARALGGPVAGGKSYLVGEKGPEIFSPGLTGAISTNDTLNNLTTAGAALGSVDALGRAGEVKAGGGAPSLAPKAEDMAKATQSGSTTVHHGDKHVSLRVEGGGMGAEEIGREAERAIMRVLGRMESDQRGNLSD